MIDDAGFFQLRARLGGHSGDLRPGSYELRKDMSFAAALDALQEGVAAQRGPGERSPRASRAGDRARSTAACAAATCAPAGARPSSNPRDYGAEGATSLEGFLFPATYELKKGRRWRACATSSSRTSSATSQGGPELRASARTSPPTTC